MFAFSKISVLLIVVAGQVQSVKVCFSSKNSLPKDADGKFIKKEVNVFIKAGDCNPVPFASMSEPYGYSCLGNMKSLILTPLYYHHDILKPVIHTSRNFGVYEELTTDTSEVDYPDGLNICLTWGVWYPAVNDHKRLVHDFYLNFITDPKFKLEHLMFFDATVSLQKIDLYVAEIIIPEIKDNEYKTFRGPQFIYGSDILGNKLFTTKMTYERFQLAIGNMDIQRNCKGHLYFVFPLGSKEKDLVKKAIEGSLTPEEMSSPDVWKNIESFGGDMLSFRFQRVKDPEITLLKTFLI